MNSLVTLRKSVLNITQHELGEEVGSSQTKICRAEKAQGFPSLPSQVFLMLQDLVFEKTKICLPSDWYFRPPSNRVLLSHFNVVSPSVAPVTGMSGETIPGLDDDSAFGVPV